MPLKTTPLIQEVFNKVFSERTMSCENLTLADMDQARRDAALAAHHAEISPFSGPEFQSRSVRVTNEIPLLNAPQFKLELLPTQAGIFNKIVMGENAHNFRFLELIINTMRESGSTSHLLLVGPPSVGKTTTAQIVSRALERPMLPMSGATMGSDLFDVVDIQLSNLHGGKFYSEVYKHPDNGMPVYRVAPSVIFVDEAHLLPKKMQTALLMATEAPHVVPSRKGRLVDFRDVLMILGTTDPSTSANSNGLVKPLRTRCSEVVFQAYGVSAVAEIVGKQFPYLTFNDSISLARAAKLVPRVALLYAKQAEASRISPGTFLRDFIGVDSDGLDALDQRLLETLKNSAATKNLMKLREAELLIEAANNGAKVTTIQITKAKALIEHKEYKPLSIAALADRLQMTDEVEVQTRVHFLELIGRVERTPRGVVLKG